MTMTPDLRETMSGSTALAQRHTPPRSTSSTTAHASSVSSCAATPAGPTSPALFTSTSTAPSSSRQRLTAPATSSCRLTSATAVTARTPRRLQRSAVSSRSRVVASGYGQPSMGAQTSTSMRSSPRSAKAVAVARPTPRPAPVMSTVLAMGGRW